MSKGSARRARFDDLAGFAVCISALASHEAIALGALRQGLPENVQIDTKKKLEQLNGSAAPDLIARTSEHIVYRPGQPALALLDYDTKGMPAAVAGRVKEAGGFWPALVSVLPDRTGSMPSCWCRKAMTQNGFCARCMLGVGCTGLVG